ncbi:MAG: HEAT repeat domain-containing protein [Phycisphaerae bacterium]|jgi:HEAT repeat protein|nr:HEAT repeat domain-containing protein [Phycisphaerae bacterium]
MTNKTIAGIALAAGAAGLAANNADAAPDQAKVDEAIKSLKEYDWGADRKTLDPIAQAINATHGDAAARKKIETALIAALPGASRSAQDFICRRLRVVGTTASVKPLAALLCDEKASAIARYALERHCCPSATDALSAALGKASKKLKPGIIGSLGIRRDKKSVSAICKFLSDSDGMTARAATKALALIGTPDAAKALCACAAKAPAAIKVQVADACLICAEQLLADGEKAAAIGVYKALKGDDQPKHVKVAAMKGMLTAASKK